MVSILLDKMNVCVSILATDGDDGTMKLLRENVLQTGTSLFFIVLYCIGLDWIGLDLFIYLFYFVLIYLVV